MKSLYKIGDANQLFGFVAVVVGDFELDAALASWAGVVQRSWLTRSNEVAK